MSVAGRNELFSFAYSRWPTFHCAYVNNIILTQYIWLPTSLFAVKMHVYGFVLCVSVFVCMWVHCLWKLWYTYNKERRRKKKDNQLGSSLGPVAKVIQRFYQWAKVPVAMETLMNEKGPCNRGDDVNEELPHLLDNVCDGGCCLETEFFTTVVVIIIIIIIIAVVNIVVVVMLQK